MRAKMIKTINFILAGVLVVGGLYFGQGSMQVVEATTIKEVQDQIKDTQNKITGIEDQIDTLTDEQDLVYEKMDDLNSEIINMMTSISLLEDQITLKEAEIEKTQKEYETAVQKQLHQEEAMALSIQFMYEKGSTTMLQMILESKSFSDFLNKLEYAEAVYKKDKEMLDSYKENKQYIHDVWDQLEADKISLQADMASLEEQKSYCNTLLNQLKAEAADYDALIANAKREAKAAKQLLKEEQAQLKKLQDTEKKKQQQANIANMTFASTSYTDIVDAASGSDLGKKIAKYGLQYIGNKYVYGGTSLTNGTDCSGFTYRIYSNFGYTIPRTSYLQRSTGTGVNYEDAQPGDLICYDGHVGLYIGGGYIVHASNARSGIKVSKATYRPILAVRRVLQ